jgi:glycosyltransferase involved in cell wall biosynthesis
MTAFLVSIGLPVYDGGEALRKAFDSLLAQTYANLEVIVSDDASKDAVTQSITEEYARRDPRIRLTRQSVNLGGVGNFLWVAAQARGEFFMWAAQDDSWSPNFVESLVKRLEEAPDAVLATPVTITNKAMRNGGHEQKTIPSAPNADRWTTLQSFFATTDVWLYGMFRTKWLQTALPEMDRYSWFVAHFLFLYGIVLNERVVGSDDAFFYKSKIESKYGFTQRQRIEILAETAYHVMRLSWSHQPASERFRAMRFGVYFIGRLLKQRNVMSTAARVVKISVLLTWFGLEAGIRRVASTVRASVVRPR